MRTTADQMFAASVSRLDRGLESVLFQDPEHVVAVLDVDGVVLDVHFPPDLPFRSTRDDFVGRQWWDTPISPSARKLESVWRRRLQDAATSDGPRAFEGDRKSLITGAFQVHGHVAAVRQDGAVVGFVISARNVGAQREALERSEARFQGLVETLPHMAWICGPTGAIDYLAPSWEQFLGKPVADLVGFGIDACVHPQDRSAAAGRSTPARDGKLRSVRMRRHDGVWRDVESVARVVRGDDGAPLFTVGAALDVTDLRLEEQARLRHQKIQALGTLAGGVAHDVNNVISAILSYADLAERQMAADESPAESVAEISRGAARARDVVRRLLTFSRDETPRSEWFALGPVAEEAVALVRPTFAPGVTAAVMIAADLPRLYGDATQLHQVVVNLVTNAAQALEDDSGTIRLVVDQVDDGRRDGASPDRYVRLRVIDDGPGIPPHLAARIFDPFFTTKAADRGTGLGLAAVQSIVDHHGGSIGVASIPSPVTTFTVHLPVPTPAQSTGAAVDADARATGSVSAIFVDDDATLVRLAERIFPASGCAVTGFTDPADALAFLRANRTSIDVLITDLSMPTIGGLELVGWARAFAPDLPVVLTSGRVDDRARAQVATLERAEVIAKPYALHDLVEVVQRIARRN